MMTNFRTIMITFFVLGSPFGGLPGWGQIPTKQVVVGPAEETKPATFDGSRNFVGNDYKTYVGQELFLPCISKELRSFGYKDFFTYVFPSVEAMLDASKKGDPDGSIYMKGTENSKFSSRYDALANRSFTVIGTQVRPPSKGLPQEVYLKLSAKDRKETLFFKYTPEYEHTFPFVAMAYFEKQKQTVIAREFITRGRNWISDELMTDINSGKPIDFPPGMTWKVVDVAMADCMLSMIMENDKKEQVAFPIRSHGSNFWVVAVDEAKAMAKQFGKVHWPQALAGHVNIGMSAEAAQFAWGTPKSKNTTVTSGRVSEQWVYKGGRTFYVENGKVTAIQD